MLLPTAASAVGSGAAVLVSSRFAWAVLACTGRAGQSYHLRNTLGENDSASWWKTTGGIGLIEGRGGFLVLLDVFTHVGRDPWCSRGFFRAPVAEIFRWKNALAGTIGVPAWTGVGLHTLHSQPDRTALGCCEEYIPRGHGRPHVSGGGG